MTLRHARAFVAKHGDELSDRIDTVFEKFDLTEQIRKALLDLAVEVLCGSFPTPNHSGLVIAGFGERAVFPALTVVTVEGTVRGKLKYDTRHEVEISRDGKAAAIVPFAQREMVERFMEGVDPAFLEYLKDSMGEASTQLALEVLKGFNVDCTSEQEEVVRAAALQQAKGTSRKRRSSRTANSSRLSWRSYSTCLSRSSRIWLRPW